MNWLDLNAKQDYLHLINSGSVPEVKVNKKTGDCYDYNSLIGGHVHHIKPRSEGGTNNPSNLVDLRYQDHLKAHYLLSKGIKTDEARQAYRCMITFQGDWGEEPELTEEMAEEYAIARAKHREIVSDLMSKPVACVKGYIHPETIEIFKNQDDCAKRFGTSRPSITQNINSNEERLGIGRNPKRIQARGSKHGFVILKADSEWINSYIETGAAPHIDLTKIPSLKEESKKWMRSPKRESLKRELNKFEGGVYDQ